MAWFGESLSSLKGQITNFTKDIVVNNVVGLSSDDNADNEGKLRSSDCLYKLPLFLMNLKSTSVSVVLEVSLELVGSALPEIRPLLTAIIVRPMPIIIQA